MSALGLLRENECEYQSMDQLEQLRGTILRQNHRLRQWYVTIQKAQQTILFDQRCEIILFGYHKTLFNA